MTYQVGSVYYTTGTPAEIALAIENVSYIFKTSVAWSGVAGSYTVFIEADDNN